MEKIFFIYLLTFISWTLFQELSEKVRIFQSINASAQDAISVNLHKIQSVLNSGQPDAGVYSASGTNKPDETHFTNRFV